MAPLSKGPRGQAGPTSNPNGHAAPETRSPWNSSEFSAPSSTDGDARAPRSNHRRLLYAPHPMVDDDDDDDDNGRTNNGILRRSMSPGEQAQFDMQDSRRRRFRDGKYKGNKPPKDPRKLSTLERSLLGQQSQPPTSNPSYFPGSGSAGSPTPPQYSSMPTTPMMQDEIDYNNNNNDDDDDPYDGRDGPSSLSTLFGSKKEKKKTKRKDEGSVNGSSCGNSLSGAESATGGGGGGGLRVLSKWRKGAA